MTTPTQSTPLKACPFCGSKAKQYGTNVIGCTNTVECGGNLDFGHYTGKPDPLIAAWNTRADAPLIADDELRRISEYFEKHRQVSLADVAYLIRAATNPTPPITGDRQATLAEARELSKKISADVEASEANIGVCTRTNQRLSAMMRAVDNCLTAPVPREVLNGVSIWLSSSLKCKAHPWDDDQREAAQECLNEALALLGGKDGG